MKKWFAVQYTMHFYIFFFYVGIASFYPFLGFWFTEMGLTSRQIGLILSIGPTIGILVQPVWGTISDRFGITHKLLMLCVILAPVLNFGYRFHYDKFLIYMLVALGGAVFSSAISPFTETMTLNHAHIHNQSYGSIRVMGALSFAIVVTPIGLLYEKIGIKHMFEFYLFTMLIVLYMLWRMDHKIEKNDHKQRRFEGITLLLKQRHFLLFLFWVFLIAIGAQFYNVFFSVYLSHSGGSVSKNIGILNTIAGISELPVYLFSGRLIVKYGARHLLVIASIISAVRWIILSFEPNFWLLVLNQALHGLTLALFFTVGINWVYIQSSAGYKTTGQTLFTVVYVNISVLISSNIGGWIVDSQGFSVLFLWGAAISLVGAAGFFFSKTIYVETSL